MVGSWILYDQKVCQLHGGVYVKFGQYVASLVRIIPEEYTDTLR